MRATFDALGAWMPRLDGLHFSCARAAVVTELS